MSGLSRGRRGERIDDSGKKTYMRDAMKKDVVELIVEYVQYCAGIGGHEMHVWEYDPPLESWHPHAKSLPC